MPVVIIGGGAWGARPGEGWTSAAWTIASSSRRLDRVRNPEKYVVGDAAELDILKHAGIMETSTVIVTTHDDDTNIYLDALLPRLRPDIQIISRATRERNVATLQRAGADFIMSYASMGSRAILNLVDKSSVLMVAEGLDVFRVKLPASLVGRSLADAHIRRQTGCTVIAIRKNGETDFDFSPETPLTPDTEMILIGTVAAEKQFMKMFK